VGLALIVPIPTFPRLLGTISTPTSPSIARVTPNSGLVTGGTAVTIYGHNFLGAANACGAHEAVYFGADPQYDYPIEATSFQVISNDEIVAIAPPDYGGRVDIQVSNLCGTSQPTPSYDSFTYTYDDSRQCLSNTCQLTIDGTSENGPIGHVASGFNSGYNTDAGHTIPPSVPSMMRALHPQSWRLGGGLGPAGQLWLARDSGAAVTSLLETDWLNSGGTTTPWLELPVFSNFVRQDVQQREKAGTAPAYWDVWNEPDNTGTVNQYLSLYQVAYEAIKAVDADAQVIGPSIGYFLTLPAGSGNNPGSQLDLTTFASFASSHNLKFAAVTYHDQGTSAPPGTAGVPRDNYTPSTLATHVQSLRSLLARIPNLGNPRIFVNEYGPGYAILTPGGLVGSLASLESARVDAAELTCLATQDCDTMMDGLFTTAGTPQMPYWVFYDYANLTGQRLATTSTGTNFSALATRNDASSQIQIMLGRHDACGSPPRPSVHAGLPNMTCPEYQPPVHGPVSLSLSVVDPYPASQVQVTISPLPNSARNPDGANPVPQSPGSTTTTVSAVGGRLSIPLASVGDGDAYNVVISPAT
jgi:hypothetical protein